MTDEWGRPQMAGNIYSPQFFVPVHSRFSPFPVRFRVPGMVCSRVESGTNDSASHSLSLSPPSLSLTLSHSVCLVSEWAYLVCWLAPPPSPFLSVIDTFSLLCPMFCSHCSKIFLSFPSVSASTLPYVYLLSLSPQPAIIFCVWIIYCIFLFLSLKTKSCGSTDDCSSVYWDSRSQICVCVCGTCTALFWGLAEMMGRKQQGINRTEGSRRRRTMEEWIQKYELRREWILGFKETIDLILEKLKYLGESQPNIEYL